MKTSKLDITRIKKDNNIKALIHLGDIKTALSHLEYWVAQFFASKIEFCVLVRDIKSYNVISKKFLRTTIVFAQDPLDVEVVINALPRLKATFFTSNVAKNIHLLRFNDIKHIYIGSENSDQMTKVTNYFRAYDEMWISSDSMVDKFKKEKISLRHLDLKKVGKPQLKEMYNSKKEERQLLYIPSWEGQNEASNFSSLNLLSELIHKLHKKLDITLDVVLDAKIGKRDKLLKNLKNHINEYSLINDLGIGVYTQDTTKLSLIKKSSFIICDIATLCNKCLASGSIIFVYIPKDKPLDRFFQDKYIFYDYAYPFSSINELLLLMQGVIKGTDSLKVKRVKAMEYLLGQKETLQDYFINSLKKI